MERVEIYDVSPRDGDQAAGVNLGVREKLWFANNADELRFDYVEAGFPLSNSVDQEVLRKLSSSALTHTKVVAFGMTCRKGQRAADNEGLKSIVNAGPQIATLVGKSCIRQVSTALQTTGAENHRMIRESITFVRGHGLRVFFDAEHFFDGWKRDSDYALSTLREAVLSGAEYLVLCDTNGGSTPEEIAEIVEATRKALPDCKLGIHPHNDRGMATANMRAAVFAGVSQIQGTINGFGERTGNLCLVEAIANLHIDGIPTINDIDKLTQLSREAAAISKISVPVNKPLVGANAFAHKGGMHASAVERNPECYEIAAPESFGNQRRIIGSKQSGISNIRQIIRHSILVPTKFREDLANDSGFLANCLEIVKKQEGEGFNYDFADASLAILLLTSTGLVHRQLLQVAAPVIIDELGRNTRAVINISFADSPSDAILEAGEGTGPIEALANALLKASRAKHSSPCQVRLADFESAKSASSHDGAHSIVNVRAQFTDGEDTWRTSGASRDSIEAGWQCILDAIEYKILKDMMQNPPLEHWNEYASQIQTSCREHEVGVRAAPQSIERA